MRFHQLADFYSEVAWQVLHIGDLAIFDHRLADLRFCPWLVFFALIDDAFAGFRLVHIGITST
ncbi:hypothetical protein D3C71_1817240 [compost metagenome]